MRFTLSSLSMLKPVLEKKTTDQAASTAFPLRCKFSSRGNLQQLRRPQLWQRQKFPRTPCCLLKQLLLDLTKWKKRADWFSLHSTGKRVYLKLLYFSILWLELSHFFGHLLGIIINVRIWKSAPPPPKKNTSVHECKHVSVTCLWTYFISSFQLGVLRTSISFYN